MTYCEACGRKRPTYAATTENDDIVFMCGDCLEMRLVD